MKIKRLLGILATTMLLFVLSAVNQPIAAQCPYCDHGYIYVSRSSGTYGISHDKKKCPICDGYYCVGESHVHRCPYCSGGSASSNSSYSDDDEGDNASTANTDGLFDDQVRTKGEFADMPDLAINNTGIMPYDPNPSVKEDELLESAKKKKKDSDNSWIWGLGIAAVIGFFLWKK